jgi:hypothetical protein
METLLVEGVMALHDVDRRLPDAERRNRLGIAAPAPIAHRQQLRRVGQVCVTHRRQPNTVTMIMAGRPDPEAYPAAYLQPPPPPPGGRRNHHNTPYDTHGTIIRRIDAYTTAAGTQDATKAFFRQQFGTTYNDAIAGLEVYDEIVERPLDNAKALEAQCPYCQQWYTDAAGARAHVERRHQGQPVPNTFQHHRGVVGGGRAGARRTSGRRAAT